MRKQRFGLPAQATPAAGAGAPRGARLLPGAGRPAVAEGTGSANRVARALLLDEPPHIDRGEVTDKGSINQRAVLAHRAELVERLYAEVPDAQVLLPRR